jgi:hypothetical protein
MQREQLLKLALVKTEKNHPIVPTISAPFNFSKHY